MKHGVTVQNATSYATRSNDNYAENTHGLVTAEYAAELITNWEEKKPAGKRNLFVMQYGSIVAVTPDEFAVDGNTTHIEYDTAGATTTTNNGYIKHDASKGVYVFDRTSGCTTTGDSRNDGVSSVPKPVFSIADMDAAFAHYGIDPNQDVLMLALGAADAKGGYMAGVARMWYTLTYWGFPQESILLLNGQATNVLNPEYNSAIADLGLTREDIFTALPSAPSGAEWKSIATVKTDGTILQATMKDMMQVAKRNSDRNLILDARSSAEFAGTKRAKTEYKLCGDSKTEQCYTAFDGHIKGASNLLFSNVLNIADRDLNGDGLNAYNEASYTFKTLGEIETLFANAGYDAGDRVYTYCRTGTKASLLTFVSSAMLGYETRMYDGSWIQWGKMASEVVTTDGETISLERSRWRTDTQRYSESVTYHTELVSPINAELNLRARKTDAIIKEDKAAKYTSKRRR